VLGVRTTTTFGPSIYTITSTGTFKLIYSFRPAVNSMQTVIQATNRRLYGPAFSATTSPANFYFSLTGSGQTFRNIYSRLSGDHAGKQSSRHQLASTTLLPPVLPVPPRFTASLGLTRAAKLRSSISSREATERRPVSIFRTGQMETSTAWATKRRVRQAPLYLPLHTEWRVFASF